MKKTILFAVGASGGHIYPAVSIAERLKETWPDHWDIHFVHSGSPTAKKVFSALKYPVHEISIGGLASGQSFYRRLKTLYTLPKALFLAVALIRKLKAHVVFGTGGAVTGPVLLAGKLMNCKTAIWEGNAVLGLANRWLIPFVSRVFTFFPKVKGMSEKNQQVCGYPLRRKFHSRFNEPLIKSKFFSKDQNNLFKVLILGGSQGSVFLNQIVSQAVQETNWRKDIFIYHQTGEKSFNSIKEKYQSLQGMETFAFSTNIEEYYQKCELIFSRAGSGAIGEIASYGKALVLIPLTYSAGGHQVRNARELFYQNCADVIYEKNLNVKTFKEKLIQLKLNRQKRKQLASSLNKFSSGDGAKAIADWISSSVASE